MKDVQYVPMCLTVLVTLLCYMPFNPLSRICLYQVIYNRFIAVSLDLCPLICAAKQTKEHQSEFTLHLLCSGLLVIQEQ